MSLILGDSLLRNDKSLEAALSNKLDKTITTDQEISSGLILPNNKNINSYDNNNNISRIAQINLDKLEFGSNTIQTNIYSLNRPKVFTKINSTITENEVAYKSEIDELPITLKSTFLPLAGGIMTGAITIPNNIGIETKNTSGTNINLIRMSDVNIFEIGSSGSIGVVLTNGEFRPFGAKSGQLNLGNSSIKWKDLYLTGTANANTVSATNLNGTTIKQNNKVVANQEDLDNEITNRQTAITNLTNTIASTYLPLAGGTLSANAQIIRAGKSASWVKGRDVATIKNNSWTQYNPLLSMKTTIGSWELGPYIDNILHFSYVTDSNYTSNNNTRTSYYSFSPDPLYSGTVVGKQYIETNYLPLTGGNLSGNLNMGTGNTLFVPNNSNINFAHQTTLQGDTSIDNALTLRSITSSATSVALRFRSGSTTNTSIGSITYDASTDTFII